MLKPISKNTKQRKEKDRKLCKICQLFYCPPECPSYVGISPEYGRPIGRCDECGNYIYDGDFYYAEGGVTLCSECAEACD